MVERTEPREGRTNFACSPDHVAYSPSIL
jgi:hypothetical protein